MNFPAKPAFAAMMEMAKIDIANIEAARRGRRGKSSRRAKEAHAMGTIVPIPVKKPVTFPPPSD
jgi:hypothetical protein